MEVSTRTARIRSNPGHACTHGAASQAVSAKCRFGNPKTRRVPVRGELLLHDSRSAYEVSCRIRAKSYPRRCRHSPQLVVPPFPPVTQRDSASTRRRVAHLIVRQNRPNCSRNFTDLGCASEGLYKRKGTEGINALSFQSLSPLLSLFVRRAPTGQSRSFDDSRTERSSWPCSAGARRWLCRWPFGSSGES